MIEEKCTTLKEKHLEKSPIGINCFDDSTYCRPLKGLKALVQKKTMVQNDRKTDNLRYPPEKNTEEVPDLNENINLISKFEA